MNSSSTEQAALETARDLVRAAQRIVVLSGAGLSTASGIPDFRGPQGVWTADPDAEKVSTLSWYLRDDGVRAKAWQRLASSGEWAARPNPGHVALAELERRGRLRAIITQNTDGLHQLAGSTGVLEVHGNARTWRCETCHAQGPMIDMVERVRAGEADPRCPRCGGIVRATTILFEEMLVPEVLDAARDALLEADLLLAVGTTLGVYPVAGFVPLAERLGIPIVIMNAEPTPFDALAAAVVRSPLQEALPALLA